MKNNYRVLKGGLTCKPKSPYYCHELSSYRCYELPDCPLCKGCIADIEFDKTAPTYDIATSTPMKEGETFEGELIELDPVYEIVKPIEPQTVQEAKTNGEGWLNEYIICSAILINDGIKHEHQPKNIESGFVVSGRRHHNCYSTLAAIAESAGLDTQIKNLIEKTGRDEQGFITNTHRFVDRKEGYLIAQKANQIVFGAGLTDKENQILISENLY